MNCKISYLSYCPVKSLSFQKLTTMEVVKELGVLNDRVFAFSRLIDYKKALLAEKDPRVRNLNNFLTLKNTPKLNQYKLEFSDDILTLSKSDKKILSINFKNPEECEFLAKEILSIDQSIKGPVYLLYNNKYPFYDTTDYKETFNSISLINLNSIKDFEDKINKKIEHERFRGNIYIEGLKAWEESNWIDKTIIINDIRFKVDCEIPRCSATNLKPNTDSVTLNLPSKLIEIYEHCNLGVYLKPLDNGKISIGDNIKFN